MGQEKKLTFTISLNTRDLWEFSMYHSCWGLTGIFNVIFTCAALLLLILRFQTLSTPNRLLLVFCALLFTVVQPLMLYRKAARQAKTSGILDTMELTFDEEGLQVVQNEKSSEMTWDQMGRMDRMPTMVILYMDRVHAFLLPNRFLGEQMEALLELSRKHLPKERRRRI